MKELQQQIAELVEAAREALPGMDCRCAFHGMPCAYCQLAGRLRRALEPFNTQPKA